MSKARRRRQASQRDYLANLARRSRDLFEIEWRKRVNSYAKRIHHLTGRLRETGSRLQPAYIVIVEALELLKLCGPEADARYRRETEEILIWEFIRASGSKIDSDLCHLSNTRSNYKKMLLGTHKPPR